MPIVFAAIAPHSPLLLATIGKDHTSQLGSTLEAYRQLAQDLYASKVETLIIISPHGEVHNNSFIINLSPQFTANLEKFGDYVTKTIYAGDIGLSHQIRERLETAAPLQMISSPELDYGSSIPLELLLSSTVTPMIIPVYNSSLGNKEHFEFGNQLKRELLITQRRVGIIASSDLSHRLSATAPGGYSAKGEKFDRKLIEALQKKQTSEVVNLSDDLISEALECGLKSIVTLLGILDGINTSPTKLSYESPFGVGQLVMQYHF